MKNNPLKLLALSPKVLDGLLTGIRQLFLHQNATFTGGKS
jgi:hypothetical protein